MAHSECLISTSVVRVGDLLDGTWREAREDVVGGDGSCVAVALLRLDDFEVLRRGRHDGVLGEFLLGLALAVVHTGRAETADDDGADDDDNDEDDRRVARGLLLLGAAAPGLGNGLAQAGARVAEVNAVADGGDGVGGGRTRPGQPPPLSA